MTSQKLFDHLSDLEKFLLDISKKRVAFIGVGNSLRGDDVVGCYVVDMLKSEIKDEKFLFINAGISVENYLNKIIEFKPDVVLFIDALRNKDLQKDFVILQKKDLQNYSFSTHNISFVTLIEYLQQQLEEALFFLLAIKIESLDIKDTLTKNTKEIADIIVKIFLKVLKKEQTYA